MLSLPGQKNNYLNIASSSPGCLISNMFSLMLAMPAPDFHSIKIMQIGEPGCGVPGWGGLREGCFQQHDWWAQAIVMNSEPKLIKLKSASSHSCTFLAVTSPIVRPMYSAQLPFQFLSHPSFPISFSFSNYSIYQGKYPCPLASPTAHPWLPWGGRSKPYRQLLLLSNSCFNICGTFLSHEHFQLHTRPTSASPAKLSTYMHSPQRSR